MGPLLAVPNFSEGRDRATVERIAAAAQAGGADLLDVHRDDDHHRSVLTLAGPSGRLAEAVLEAARVALDSIDLRGHEGAHPRVGVLDVAPIVFLDQPRRGPACAEALVLGDLLGSELGLPVLLYGSLSAGRTRADLRRGGVRELGRRLADGELVPDYGPSELDPARGAVLLAARPPLVAFNLVLTPPADLEDARAIAARIREGGDAGLPGVRALGLWLSSSGRAQVSTNVENPGQTSLAMVVASVSRFAQIAEAEQVGLAPEAAYAGFPQDLRVRGRRTLEEVLAKRQPIRGSTNRS